MSDPTAGETLEALPLFASLYPAETAKEIVLEEYVSLFSASQRVNPATLFNLETEVLYHYTVDEQVRRSIDAVVDGQRGTEPADRVRYALRKRDLSSRLRRALSD